MKSTTPILMMCATVVMDPPNVKEDTEWTDRQRSRDCETNITHFNIVEQGYKITVCANVLCYTLHDPPVRYTGSFDVFYTDDGLAPICGRGQCETQIHTRSFVNLHQ